MRRALQDGAHARSLAGERDQEVVAAVAAPRTREAVGEDAALQVAAELTLDIFRNRTVVVVAVAALGEPGLEVLLDAAIEHALARAARPVPRGCAAPGPALDLHACPLSPAFRGWGSAWPARGAGRHWPRALGRAAHGGLGGCGWRSWGRQAMDARGGDSPVAQFRRCLPPSHIRLGAYKPKARRLSSCADRARLTAFSLRHRLENSCIRKCSCAVLHALALHCIRLRWRRCADAVSN